MGKIANYEDEIPEIPLVFCTAPETTFATELHRACLGNLEKISIGTMSDKRSGFEPLGVKNRVGVGYYRFPPGWSLGRMPHIRKLFVYGLFLNESFREVLNSCFPNMEELEMRYCSSVSFVPSQMKCHDENALTWAQFWKRLRTVNPRLLKIRATNSTSDKWDLFMEEIRFPRLWPEGYEADDVTWVVEVEGEETVEEEEDEEEVVKWPYVRFNGYPISDEELLGKKDYREYRVLSAELEKRRRSKE